MGDSVVATTLHHLLLPLPAIFQAKQMGSFGGLSSASSARREPDSPATSPRSPRSPFCVYIYFTTLTPLLPLNWFCVCLSSPLGVLLGQALAIFVFLELYIPSCPAVQHLSNN